MGAEHSKGGARDSWVTDCCGSRNDGCLPTVPPRHPYRNPPASCLPPRPTGVNTGSALQATCVGMFQRATSAPGQFQRATSAPGQVGNLADECREPKHTSAGGPDAQSRYDQWRRSPVHKRLHVMREPLSAKRFRLHSAAKERDFPTAERLLADAGMHRKIPDCTLITLVDSSLGMYCVLKFDCRFPGQEVNQRDIYGRTPLHFAAFVGDLEICKLLIRKGADTDALTQDGKSVINCAIDGNQSGVCICYLSLFIHHLLYETSSVFLACLRAVFVCFSLE
jgi:hypothetical protein